jgi:hypothetical protein
VSSTIKNIKSSKHHGKLVELDGIQYERIGDDVLYNIKTSRLKLG